VVGAFLRYRNYLQSVRDAFPPSAYALAVSDWYFNFSDHRSPHDAWLESFTLCETSSGRGGEERRLTLLVRLLGAFHDGYIELRYPRVMSYALNMGEGKRGHRDWRYDEFRISDRGALIHEIEWCGDRDAGRWVIEASDLEFRWIPG
jgi:hypothetical protein